MALEGEIFVKIDISPLGVETTHVYWNIQGFFPVPQPLISFECFLFPDSILTESSWSLGEGNIFSLILTGLDFV